MNVIRCIELIDLSGIVILVLAFIDGLLFGLAVKKGVVSFVLLIVAFILSGYVGFAFVPQVSVTHLWNTAVTYVTNHITTITSFLPIGNIGSLSLIVVLFLVGLAVGIWKG